MEAARSQSFARFPRLDGMPEEHYDVAILGGGLAGLTLALQIKQSRPETSVFVAEKREGPAPAAAFKVGESTVELAANYFSQVLGLKDHLESDQLPKLGLRFFFPAGDNRDIAGRLEWGSAGFAPVPSYQLDRGSFENELFRRNLVSGVHAFDACRVEDVELGRGEHSVMVTRDDEAATVKARWVVDAAGRRFIIKKKLGLGKEVEHDINSSWLRLAGGLDIESFSDDKAWLDALNEPRTRRFSTNHLMGEGYWVWLIPLSSGAISIGIVADPRFHPFEQINTLDGAIDWLKRHEPLVGEAIDARRGDIEDFLKVQRYSHGCERVYHPDRWCMTGEAGVFLDPFYSPGSDFIAMSNTYVTDLIVRDLDGEDVTERAEAHNASLLKSFEDVLRGYYLDQYGHWGNAEVMHAKFVFEYTQYWAMTVTPFFYRKLTDLEFKASVQDAIDRSFELLALVAQVLRDWHRLSEEREWPGVFVKAGTVPAMIGRYMDLIAGFDDEELRAKFAENIALLEAMAVSLFHKAASRALPGGGPDPERAVNPYAIGLDPDRWESDGLFDGSGMTLSQARDRIPEADNLWLDDRLA